ncbi:hypothetical protein J1N35_008236 [Gossypium stocksii]|uniref:Uncharacterized protein n=1 Tax=Gossypium stocksii TaxID=47602 RepID=A0A9D3WA09_9ROSI|nr:hypothetical protein J1N35_008236 [Gossypium stocksii]
MEGLACKVVTERQSSKTTQAKLKKNILLHTQVTGGPFNAHKVDFDALNRVDMSELGFGLLCPLGVA